LGLRDFIYIKKDNTSDMKVETDLKKIKQTSRKKEDENWEKDLNKYVPYKIHLSNYNLETPEDFHEKDGNVVKSVSR